MDMKEHPERTGKLLGVLGTCCLIFIVLVSAIFAVQQSKLNEEYDTLIGNNLSAYTKNQKRQLNGKISDILSTMGAVAAVMDTNGLSAKEDWFGPFLNRIGDKNKGYHLEYLDMDEIRKELEKGDCWFTEQKVYQQLLQNGSTVSDHFRVDEEGKYYFAVGIPVSKGGSVTGILQTEIPATILTSVTQESRMYKEVSTFITARDGEIVYSKVPDFATDSSLFGILEERGISKDDENKVRDMLEKSRNTEITDKISLDKISYYVSVEKMDYNGWYIANFVSEDNVLVSSHTVYRNVLLTGMLLILLTIAVVSVVFVVLRKQQRARVMEQKRFAALSQFSDTVLFEYFCGQDVLEFTNNARDMLGLDTLRFEKFSHRLDNGSVHPDDREIVYRTLKEMPHSLDTRSIQLRVKGKEGRYNWYSCHLKAIFDKKASASVVVGKLQDITEVKHREQRLMEISERDVLTNTYNKSAVGKISQRLKENAAGVLFMIDLDDFKSINDKWGHEVGDIVLKKVGEVLNKTFRSDDLVVRMGGDEFAVFLQGNVDSEMAEKKAALVLETIRDIQIQGAGRLVSASIGIAISPRDGCTFSQLYRAADTAMYRVKKSDKDGFCISR